MWCNCCREVHFDAGMSLDVAWNGSDLRLSSGQIENDVSVELRSNVENLAWPTRKDCMDV